MPPSRIPSERQTLRNMWSLVVAGLYGLVLFILAPPLAWLAFSKVDLTDYAEALTVWQLWILIGLMVCAQLCLLRLPVHVASGRPLTRRPLWVTSITAAFMMGLLGLAAVFCIHEFLTRAEGAWGFWLAVAVAVGSWIFWAVFFYRSAVRAGPDRAVKHMTRFLWSGSVLELLIAIPTHIVVRQRDYCCAGFMTFIGLACGMSVMIFAFGPAVYIIFIERWKRLHPAAIRKD